MSLNYEMHAGIEFEGESLSESYADTVTNDTKKSYSYDYSVDYTTPCTEDPKNPGTGLWQWVTGSNDGKSMAASTHTVCRYGSKYNSAPECPYAAYDLKTASCKSDWKA